jgi:hypothetical protein
MNSDASNSKVSHTLYYHATLCVIIPVDCVIVFATLLFDMRRCEDNRDHTRRFLSLF